MHCPLESNRPDRLVELSAGRLDDAALRRHAADCPRCAAFCRDQAAVWNTLDAFTPPPVSPGFHRALYRRIAEEERAGVWRNLFRPLPGWLLRPAAIASVLALAAMLLQSPYAFRPQHAVESIDTDNLEQTVNDLDMIRQLSLPPQNESM